MSLLEDDLKKYAKEVYTDNDVNAAKKLLVEVFGIFTLFGAGLWLFTAFIPGLGIPITATSAIFYLSKLGEEYVKLNEEDRKAVRYIANAIKKVLGG
jgi:hypothetical protein